jgi:hypothetical protein
MSDQPTTSSEAKSNKIVTVVAPILMIGLFLFRVLVPADEYPSRAVQIMEIVFDLGMFVGVIGLRAQIATALFWPAVLCGVGSFAIRLTSDAAWWTGHLMYSLR